MANMVFLARKSTNDKSGAFADKADMGLKRA